MRRVLRTAVEAARATGVPERALLGCQEGEALCDGSEMAEQPVDRCRARVTGVDQYIVGMRCAAVDGGPLEVDVSVSRTGTRAEGVSSSDNRWVSSPDGSLLVAVEPTQAFHEHGGPPALIAGILLRVYNAGAPRQVVVRNVDWIASGQLISLTPHGPPERLVPSGTSKIEVEFPSQEAYLTSDERFEVEPVIQVGDAVLRPRGRISVIRIDVARPDDEKN